MKRLRNIFTRRGWAALVLLPIAIALGAATAVRTTPAPLLVNESPSLPKGIYWRAFGHDTSSGSIVALAQPARVQPYLRSLGFPTDVLLIKRVVAVGGQSVCAEGRTLVTPSGRHPVRARDRQGRHLPVWTGCRRLGPDEVFLLGDTETSLDSRYFGPVSRKAILGVYREGLSW